MSVEDKRALQIFEKSAQLVKGHYQIAIPWRQNQPCMPNNRKIAEQRLRYLKRRLDHDPVLRKNTPISSMIFLIKDMHALFLTNSLIAVMKIYGISHITM